MFDKANRPYYRLPPNKRAEENSSIDRQYKQINKAYEELNEVKEAFFQRDKNDQEKELAYCEEWLDLILVCEGALRALSPSTVFRAYVKVMNKAIDRNDLCL